LSQLNSRIWDLLTPEKIEAGNQPVHTYFGKEIGKWQLKNNSTKVEDRLKVY
jgi:hypothetical protein